MATDSFENPFEGPEPERFSDKWWQRKTLSQYFDEFPFLREDVELMGQILQAMEKPVRVPGWVDMAGTAGTADSYTDRELTGRVRAILLQAKVNREAQR